MVDRRTLPIPIPGSELQRMHQSLAPRYGSELWEQGGHRILVIRTPGREPDIVNDLERAVEHLLPSDVRDLDHCLLIGEKRTTAVSTAPLARLMEERLEHDQKMAEHLRAQIPQRTGHAVHRDTKRLDRIVRLGLRIAKTHAHDIDDDDLDHFAAELGPRLGVPPYNEVQALHILADQDDVRIDAALVLADLRRRFETLDEVVKSSQDEEAARVAREEERRAQREQIAAVLRRKFDGSSEVIRPRLDKRARSSDPGARSVLQEMAERRSRTQHEPSAPRATVKAPAQSILDLTEAVLRQAGYETLRAPPVPGHRIELAAERDAAPAKLIVATSERCTLSEADALLAACRAVTADLGLLVAPHADEDARERLVATKAKWVRPEDLQDLRL